MWNLSFSNFLFLDQRILRCICSFYFSSYKNKAAYRMRDTYKRMPHRTNAIHSKFSISNISSNFDNIIFWTSLSISLSPLLIGFSIRLFYIYWHVNIFLLFFISYRCFIYIRCFVWTKKENKKKPLCRGYTSSSILIYRFYLYPSCEWVEMM